MADDNNKLLKAAALAGAVIAGAAGLNSSNDEEVDQIDTEQQSSELVESGNDLEKVDSIDTNNNTNLDPSSIEGLDEIIESIQNSARSKQEQDVNAPEYKMERVQHFQDELRISIEIASGTNIEHLSEEDLDVIRGNDGSNITATGSFPSEGVNITLSEDGEISATRLVINENGEVEQQHAGNTEGYEGEIPEPVVINADDDLRNNLERIENNHYEYLEEKSREAGYEAKTLEIQNEIDTKETNMPTNNNSGWSR